LFLAALELPVAARTWIPTTAPATNWSALSCSADATKVFAAARGGQIYVSTDSGVSWTATASPVASWEAVASSGDGLTLVGVAGGSLYRSTDAGATWQPGNIPETVVKAAISADGTKIATASEGVADQRLYLSTDSGTSWVVRTNYGRLYSIAWSGNGTTLGLAGAGISLSCDLGGTWQNVGGAVTSYRSMVLSSDASVLLAAGLPMYDFGLYVSADKGLTWTTADVPSLLWTTAISADGRTMAAVGSGDGNALYTSDDAGATWVQGPSLPGTGQPSLAMSADGRTIVAAHSGGGIYIFQTPPKPRIEITPGGATATVSWPATSVTCELQQSSSPTIGAWEAVAQSPTLASSNQCYEVSIPIASDRRFYRIVAK
jgi:hypothetical protein